MLKNDNKYLVYVLIIFVVCYNIFYSFENIFIS